MTKQQMELDLISSKQKMALVLLTTAPNPMEETTIKYIVELLREVSNHLEKQKEKSMARGQGEAETVPQFMEVPDGVA